jgi:dihydrofolate reductase
MGRNMFGDHPGPWDAREPWNGWWGTDPPFHDPVFVLTHHARVGDDLHGLELVRTVAAPGVTHFKFARRN